MNASSGSQKLRHGIEDRVHLIQVRQFFSHTEGNLLRAIAAALLASMILHLEGISLQLILIWFTVTLATVLGTFLIDRAVRKVELTPRNADRWVTRRMMSGGGRRSASALLPSWSPSARTTTSRSSTCSAS